MKLTDSSAEQIKLIEDLLKETKVMWQKIKDLETSQDNCQMIIDAQNVVIRRYRIAFEQLPYGIYIKNADMKYLYCNEAYAQMINMRMIDILGRTDREILSQESSDQYSACEQRVWYLDQVMEGEENHFVNDEERTFHVVRRLIKGENYDIPSLLGILIDITETKHREKKAKQLSLEQSRQIESLMSDVEQAHKFTKQQEEEFRMLRASLEMQISLRDVELERLRSELQLQTAERKKAAHVLLTKVSDLQNFVASAQKYLDSSGKASHNVSTRELDN
jgi:PAS domain S-box-containing protein